MPETKNLRSGLFIMLLIFASCSRERDFTINNLSTIKGDSLEIEFILGENHYYSAAWWDLERDSSNLSIVKAICPFWNNSDSICYYQKNCCRQNDQRILTTTEIVNYFYSIVPIPRFYITDINNQINHFDFNLVNTCETYEIYKKFVSESDTLKYHIKLLKKIAIKIPPSKKIVFWCQLVADRSCDVLLSSFADSLIISRNNQIIKFEPKSFDHTLNTKKEINNNTLNMSINR